MNNLRAITGVMHFSGRLIIIFICLGLLGSVYSQKSDFSFQIWLRTTVVDTTFPAIVSNKDWDSGVIEDYTSNSHFGKSRNSGFELGWAIALQPNGSWTWNIGDGKNRLDYLPTHSRQPINDGEWHYLAFSYHAEKRATWLYYDGELVAIYSLDELNTDTLTLDAWTKMNIPGQICEIKRMEIDKGALTSEMIKSHWIERYPNKTSHFYPDIDRTQFNLMAWNIWHGGRRDGIKEGLERTEAILRTNQADVICMQETYGSGPILADRLNMMYYYRSTNLSVMSKYPIIDTHGLYEPFRFGGVTLQLPEDKKIRVFSLWIHYLPSLSKLMETASQSEDLLIPEEKTRGSEIKDIVAALQPILAERDSIPVIVGGDFNSPSHLDWTSVTAEEHNGLVVPWPASSAMAEANFMDAYRSIFPNVLQYPGKTWSPKFKDSYQQRIDYIYVDNKGFTVKDARMLEEWDPLWPSDHAAVWARIELKP